MRYYLIAPAAVLALAACGERSDDTATNQVLVPGEPITNMQGELVPAAVNALEYSNLAAATDRYKIESAELALERSENDEVRRLAQAIIADHRRSTERLRAAAAQRQPPLALEPALSDDQQRDMDTLRGASGGDFDRIWALQQVGAHEKALGLVTGYLATADDQAMADHASAVVGPMQQHLTEARSLAERLERRS
jgi:putative membrane protein